MRLREEDLDFARKHIEHHSSSDFFPDVPEFAALWAMWDEVKKLLVSRNVRSMGEPPLLMAAPKASGGFRVVHQLNPLDALVYTALAHFVAPAVEERRAPREDGSVCSYRISTAGEGNFFDPEHDGYAQFHERSVALAREKKHVLGLDIASFYNHIYVHRVQSAVELCSSSFKQDSTDIEEFILNLNQRISVGLPVGPAASIVFSEAILIDVDEFIRNNSTGNIEYVRYVDDFRLFADSRADLESLHHELTSYLYSAHRLSFAAGKQRLQTTSEFLDELLEPPEEAEERERLEEDVEAAIAALSDEGDYPSDDEENEEDEEEDEGGEDEDKNNQAKDAQVVEDERQLAFDDFPGDVQRQALVGLLGRVLSSPTLDIGMGRHILRRARRGRIRALLPHVVGGIRFLAPIIRDVGLYLDKVLSSVAINYSIAAFEDAARSTESHVPLVRHWLRWLFCTRPEFAKSRAIEQYVMGSPFDIRAAALFAETNNRASWVKSRRDTWRQLGQWDRSAVLLSAKILGKREMGVWMDAVVSNPSSALDSFIARYLKGL